MNLKAHVPGHQDHTITAEAERGEHAAISAYDHALSGMLPPTAIGLIEAQRDELRAARGRILALDHV
jgi:hypothetical protein